MKTRIDIKILGAESAVIKSALATYLKTLGYACQCGADTITALKKQEDLPEMPPMTKEEVAMKTATIATKQIFGKK
jgi:hypothetical protein